MSYVSHGTGMDWTTKVGVGTVIESTVKMFNPEFIEIGAHCYIGHGTILKGYPKMGGRLFIGSRVWIGENCYLNAAGGIAIEDGVGIGPYVSMLTSSHEFDLELNDEVMRNPLRFQAIAIRKGADVGFGTKLLPGVTIGRYSVIGAGSVLTKEVGEKEVWVGNPAKLLRKRLENNTVVIP